MYAERILEFVSKKISESHHIEFYLSWSTQLLTIHAPKENIFKQQSLLSVQDSLTRKYDALSKICDFNKYTLKVLIEMGKEAAASQYKNEGIFGESDEEDEEEEDDDDDDDDFDEENLFLMKQPNNGTNDSDVDMQTDSGESSNESDD